ncbi:ATP-binding protein [Daejeonella sp. JGW-45]|uniref:ATP-binding response regulator n=1 Tax=Daejeonella sp. JGW-45 TaxID=3034148 RepID=UPI0023ED968F|nr:ATP-binding protein [Daejeonella sp. JGW-45]
MNPIPFRKMIKGKVIIAFLIACTALFLAWSVSNVAFREMLKTVEQFSEPDERLSVVNNLYRRITKLEQVQRSLSAKAAAEAPALFRRESRHLMHSLDTLQKLYKGDKSQVGRIYTMKVLLRKREKLFADYLTIRGAIVNNKALNGELSSLNELLLDNSKRPDSTTVLKAENRSTTTIIPARKEETPVGLLKRIFGKRTNSENTTPQKIINEELSITIDTFPSAVKDSLVKSVDSVLVNLQKKQKQQAVQFISREKQLTDAGNVLVSQMLTILEQVENEVVKQSRANHLQALLVVSKSSREIKLIIMAFFLVTACLGYFILTDITRNNKYRQMLEHANQEAAYHTMAKQRFLSNMSHEIRTPLQAIMGYAELTKQQNEAGSKNIDAIYNSSGHLLQIVNEVLDYSNIISGKFNFTNCVFRLEDLVDEVISVMRVHAEKKTLVLIPNYELNTELYLEGDPFRLKQIFYNLIGNAVKYTETGTITLTVAGKENNGKIHLNIQVEDTGIGISPEDTRHIFSEFERTENAARNNSSGTGLGLSIVQTIVSHLGGRIYVKSTMGEGSCFTVYLPFIKAEKPAQAITIQEHTDREPYDGSVWMVDDDGFILQLCSAIFEKNNIDYKCFSDPLALLKETHDEKLRCVLLDMRMPRLNGAELCSILRKKLPVGIHIFALTAQALPWEQENVMRQGFDGLLMKPFREAELVNLIYSTTEEQVGESLEPMPDLEYLTEMSFGNNARVLMILKQFVSDSLSDCTLLEIAISSDNVEDCRLLLHRIAGRTAQIGSQKLAADFRLKEIVLSESSELTIDIQQQINQVIQKLRGLIDIITLQFETEKVS